MPMVPTLRQEWPHIRGPGVSPAGPTAMPLQAMGVVAMGLKRSGKVETAACLWTDCVLRDEAVSTVQ